MGPSSRLLDLPPMQGSQCPLGMCGGWGHEGRPRLCQAAGSHWDTMCSFMAAPASQITGWRWPGLHQAKHHQQVKVILLLYSALWRPHLEGQVPFWAPSIREAWAGWSEPSLGLAPPSNRQQLKAVVSLVVVFVLFFSFETFTWMKFCLWKITSLQLKETSCFSLSHHHMTAVCSQHAAFGISVLATSVLSVSKRVHRAGGYVHNMAFWADLYTFSFLQPTPFARTHKIKGSAWWRHYGYLRPGNKQPFDGWTISTLNDSMNLFPKNWAKIQVLPSSHVVIGHIINTCGYPGLQADELLNWWAQKGNWGQILTSEGLLVLIQH